MGLADESLEPDKNGKMYSVDAPAIGAVPQSLAVALPFALHTIIAAQKNNDSVWNIMAGAEREIAEGPDITIGDAR